MQLITKEHYFIKKDAQNQILIPSAAQNMRIGATPTVELPAMNLRYNLEPITLPIDSRGRIR
ncbi:MAG: hypothetical protein PVG01_04385 [Desulfobacterales bacterium]|jgi:hypothetical protein